MKRQRKSFKQRLKERAEKRKRLFVGLIISAIAALLILFFRGFLYSAVSFFVVFAGFILYINVSLILKKSERIKKMESVFPDFLQLMATNLKAGMTIDKAMFLSSRKEFSPLDEEILKTAKEITTGKEIDKSLNSLSDRLGSERIRKIIMLINSGIKAGGDIAVLLEETSVRMREREFIEKKAASSVLMYVIFIFIAVAVFAPALFSLSNILVGVMKSLLGNIPNFDVPANFPFALSSINVSTQFIQYFSVAFIIVTDVLASLVLGLVSKGEEKEGIKYMIPLIVISLTVFFVIKLFLSGFISGLFG